MDLFQTRNVVLREHPGLPDLAGYALVHDWQVWPTSYVPWPEYQELLQHVAVQDESEDVRSRALRVLELQV